MADPTIETLVTNRLVITKGLLEAKQGSIIAETIDEAKAIYGFEGTDEQSMSLLEKSYIADRAAVMLLQFALDRYKEDAESKLGPDSVEYDAQDKIKFLKEQIERLSQDAEFKRGRLGLDIVTPPGYVVKVTAEAENESDTS